MPWSCCSWWNHVKTPEGSLPLVESFWLHPVPGLVPRQAMARGASLSWLMQEAMGNLYVISLGWGLNSMGGDIPGAALTVVQLLCVFRLPLALWITPFNPWTYSTSVSQSV